jgi:hypothetical protein
MKTIIIKNSDETVSKSKLNNVIARLEKYTDRQIKDAVICTRYLSRENYNTVYGELKDATALNDFDLFIVGVMQPDLNITTLQTVNRAHTLTITDDDIDSAKNYVIMI